MIDISASTQQAIRFASDIIRSSKKGVLLSGAGFSTPSGIPDFRSPETGLWNRSDPMDVASLISFRYNPQNFYQWMRPLAETICSASPNAAHTNLATLQKTGYIQTIITQNIDGLHQKAGSINVLEVHGSMETMTCIGCYRKYHSRDFIEPYVLENQIPHCSVCGKVLKPDLVLFGEQLPTKTWLSANEASKNCDLMIVAGSSLEVLPVAGLPMRALENGAHLIIINKSRTYLDVRADVVFHEDLVDIIPEIVKCIIQH